MSMKWFSKVQAADYMHTDPGRIDQLVATGALTCSVFDGKELFFVDHLDQFLLGLQRGAAPGGAPVSPTEPPAPPTIGARAKSLAVRGDCPRKEVEEVLKELESEQANPKQHARVLTRELRKSLERSGYKSIPASVGRRLSRWASPARDDERTRFVSPLARRICELLFGCIPPRQD